MDMEKALIRYDKPNDSRFKDITGERFGKLLVTDFSHGEPEGKLYRYKWKCLCDCGNEAVVAGTQLRSGKTKSCGCLVFKRNGLTSHPLWSRCYKAINRCHNPKDYDYKYYGALGTSVQQSWRDDPELMVQEVEQEIGLPPFKGAQIDRINTYEGYESGNIQWVNSKENNNNRRPRKRREKTEFLYEKPTFKKWKDLTGQKLNMLEIIEFSHGKLNPSGKYTWYYKVRCDCGNEKVLIGAEVKRGNIKSCGCMTGKWISEAMKQRHLKETI